MFPNPWHDHDINPAYDFHVLQHSRVRILLFLLVGFRMSHAVAYVIHNTATRPLEARIVHKVVWGQSQPAHLSTQARIYAHDSLPGADLRETGADSPSAEVCSASSTLDSKLSGSTIFRSMPPGWTRKAIA